MSRSFAIRSVILALTLTPVGLAAARPTDAVPRAVDPAQSPSVMRWSEAERAAPSLAAWHHTNAPGLAAVERAWSRLLDRLRGQLPARFAAPCRLLAERLDSLDRAALLPAPDRLLDLYLQRMLWHLGQVAGRCRPDELWNVVYHLEEARRALGEVRWVLERHDLRPWHAAESSAAPD